MARDMTGNTAAVQNTGLCAGVYPLAHGSKIRIVKNGRRTLNEQVIHVIGAHAAAWKDFAGNKPLHLLGRLR